MASNLIPPYPPSFTEAQSLSKSGQGGEERKGQNRTEGGVTVKHKHNWGALQRRRERVREGQARAAMLEKKMKRNCR